MIRNSLGWAVWLELSAIPSPRREIVNIVYLRTDERFLNTFHSAAAVPPTPAPLSAKSKTQSVNGHMHSRPGHSASVGGAAAAGVAANSRHHSLSGAKGSALSGSVARASSAASGQSALTLFSDELAAPHTFGGHGSTSAAAQGVLHHDGAARQSMTSANMAAPRTAASTPVNLVP